MVCQVKGNTDGHGYGEFDGHECRQCGCGGRQDGCGVGDLGTGRGSPLADAQFASYDAPWAAACLWRLCYALQSVCASWAGFRRSSEVFQG
eukprot:scaffold105642_cov21-Tisochrysis_lutea.AAC.1